MFKKLIMQILVSCGYNQTTASQKLGYKTQSVLQGKIENKDIKLLTLATICKLCNYDIIITNNKGVNISVLQYIDDYNKE